MQIFILYQKEIESFVEQVTPPTHSEFKTKSQPLRHAQICSPPRTKNQPNRWTNTGNDRKLHWFSNLQKDHARVQGILPKRAVVQGAGPEKQSHQLILISVKWHDSRDIINHPGLVFRKIGLFTFLRDPIELNEFTPMPPKVKTGILKSPSTIGSIFEAVYWIYFFYSPFFCSYIKISSISSNFFAISSWRGYLLGFLFVIIFFYYLPMSNLGSCYISFLFYLYTVL